MKRLYLIAFVLLFSVQLFGQSFYITTGSDIKKVTVGPTGLTYQNMAACGNVIYTLANYKGQFFYTDASSVIFKADINNLTISNCKKVTQNNFFTNSLTVDSVGYLYLINGNVLVKMDRQNPVPINIGAMPYSPSGDLVFYKGNLYMASNVGIVKVDVKNPSKSTIFLTGSAVQSVYGLASVSVSSTQNKVLAFKYLTTSTTEVIELDIDNQKVGASLGVLPFQVADAASEVEDGSTVGVLKIDSITIRQDCSHPNNGILNIITPSHSDNYTFTLSNGASNLTGYFDNLAPGSYKIHISATDNSVKDTSVVVPQYSQIKPTVIASVTNEDCDVKGRIAFSDPVNGANISISLGGNLYPFSHVFTDLTAGKYSFTFLNKFGCTLDTISFTVKRIPCALQIDSIVIRKECNYINKGYVQVYCVSHTTSSYRYTLGSITNTSGLFNNLDPGKYNINIKTSEGISKDTLVVVPNYLLTKPVFVASLTDENCDVQGAITFNSSISASELKIGMGGKVYPFNNAFTGLLAGSYSFTMYNKNGCIIDTMTVTLKRIACTIQVDSIAIHKECNEVRKGSVQIYCVARSTASYNYTLNGITNTSGLFNNLNPGTYNINIKTSEGISKDTVAVVPDYYLNKPLTVIKAISPVCDITGQVSFLITGPSSKYTIQINSKSFSSDHLFKGILAGTYPFSILDKNGCLVDTLNVVINQESCNPLSFPNTFTPNGDNMNDVFRPDVKSKATQYQLFIYSRLGPLVYYTTDLRQGWEGRRQNKELPVGVYYWVATYIDQNNKPITQKGYVTLIR